MLRLKAFTENNFTQLFNFEVQVYVTAPDEVIVEYFITGPTRHLHFPALSGETETRRDELWKTTCLEAFFSKDSQSQSPYLEVNCSTNGDWNAYSFSSYREGMNPTEGSVKLLSREADEDSAHFRIRIQSPLIKQFRHMGLTAVVEFSDGSKSYYALTHPGPQADFHNKAAFIHAI